MTANCLHEHIKAGFIYICLIYCNHKYIISSSFFVLPKFVKEEFYNLEQN
jgi:hypothetical protein